MTVEFVVMTVAIILGILFVVAVIAALMAVDSPTKRQQIEQERLASEARINKVTYAALRRLFEASRRGAGPWGRP